MGAQEAQGVDGPAGGAEPGEVFHRVGQGPGVLGVVAHQLHGRGGVHCQTQLLDNLSGVEYLGASLVHQPDGGALLAG